MIEELGTFDSGAPATMEEIITKVNEMIRALNPMRRYTKLLVEALLDDSTAITEQQVARVMRGLNRACCISINDRLAALSLPGSALDRRLVESLRTGMADLNSFTPEMLIKLINAAEGTSD